MLKTNQTQPYEIYTQLPTTLVANTHNPVYAQYPVNSYQWNLQLQMVQNLRTQNYFVCNIIRAIHEAQSQENSSLPVDIKSQQAALFPGPQNNHQLSALALNNSPDLLPQSGSSRNSILQSLVMEAYGQLLKFSPNCENLANQRTRGRGHLFMAQVTEPVYDHKRMEGVESIKRSIQHEVQGFQSLSARQMPHGDRFYPESATSFQSNLGFRKSESSQLSRCFGQALPLLGLNPAYIYPSLIDFPPQSQPDRKRKNKYQLAILNAQLSINPNWSKQKIRVLAARVGLQKNQIYKWWWDKTSRKRKNRRAREQEVEVEKKENN